MVGYLNSDLSYFITTVPFPKTMHKNNSMKYLPKNMIGKATNLKQQQNFRRLYTLPTYRPA